MNVRAALVLGVLAFACSAHALERADPRSDAPEGPRADAPAVAAPTTYADALASWRSAEDIAAWLDASFVYDRDRARALSASERARRGTPPILAPAAFYAAPAGVCVDLARFGVETLAAIDPASAPRYLMIEFDPAELDGALLRRHWVAVFRRDGALHVFADSKRPGRVAGPYGSVDAFLREYADYRGRRIVAHAERDGYARATRAMAAKRGAIAGP